jgi:GT2 family glycosyltransferase
MTQTPVSVVIVSRQRPEELTLCLKALARLSYPTYELIVVADPAGLKAVEQLPFSQMIKSVPFDEANIAAARNRGAIQAAGDVVAFIDDDAQPETRWLDHLTAPFVDPAVAAAGGHVLGRNGISLQWGGRIIDHRGHEQDLPLAGENATILTPPSGTAVKTEGTNMAIRRDVLAQMGGFDPAFKFYLDETDLNMRLGNMGGSTAIVPLAQVHHGYAASNTRRKDRAVRDLHQIAASRAVFLRKHCPELDHGPLLDSDFGEQRSRIISQLIKGLLEPRDIRRLVKSWHAGIEDGKTRPLTHPWPLPEAQSEFLPFRSLSSGGVQIIKGFLSNAAKLRAQAAEAAAEGRNVSLFLFSRTTLYQTVRFHPEGYWEQVGGLWGKSTRTDSLFSPWRLASRVNREVDRIGRSRF